MKRAMIDHQDGTFHVAVRAGARVVALRSGSYPDMIRFATEQGVPRNRVTLTQAAQGAAASICFGGSA